MKKTTKAGLFSALAAAVMLLMPLGANAKTSSEGNSKITVLVQDVQPPVTTATISSNQPPTNGWYTNAATLTLSATDNSSGVAETQYQINGFGWNTYTIPLIFSEDGRYNVQYRSIDNAGNIEQAKSLTINVDRIPPTLDVTLDKTELAPPNNKLVTVNATVTASDALSGVAKIELVSITSNEPDSGKGDIQNASYGTFDTSFDLRAARSGKSKTGRIYTITYQATDVAGNVTTQSVTVTVPLGKK